MKTAAHISLLALLMLFFSVATAQQNLVPNGSFEEYTDCPTGYPDLDGKCNYWTSFRGSPDYLNDCSVACGYSNQWGYQLPRTGNAYTDFFNYENNGTNLKEQLGVELLWPLNIGVKYYVSFYVSLAYRSEFTNIATNKIGAKFTTYQYSDPNFILQLPNNCQIYTDEIITDTISWKKISGEFIADSAYRYLLIGGFFDDNLTDTIQLLYLTKPVYSYYFLDDVCVSTDPSICDIDASICDFALPTAFTPDGDNSNDVYRCITNCNNIEIFSMNIYNRWGQLVFSTNEKNDGWDGRYKGTLQPIDVYMVYVSITSNGKTISKSTSITLLQ